MQSYSYFLKWNNYQYRILALNLAMDEFHADSNMISAASINIITGKGILNDHAIIWISYSYF